ncbi:hypothetical protein [Rummeliibacillus pycnus]|uniref:hypothetical protein n=1 Tax=Rummeliibacillus pycnus TaxID=101070 RepID=UPI000C9A7B0A|nr:hypothetical protein [Rummeliibacillus pycnus]
MGAKWIKIAVVYFALGIAYGLFMHYTIELKWAAVHAHINLMGWVTSGVIGLIYSYYKQAGETSLAKAQFWLYHIGLPFLLLGMIFIHLDVPRYMMEICVSGGGIAVALSVVLFIVNVFKNIK